MKFVEEIVKCLVDNPNDVKLNVIELSSRTIIELETNVNDVGQVIGRSGSVIESIRTLLTAYSGKSKKRYNIDYVTDREKKEATKASRERS